MAKIYPGRFTAAYDGPLAVFLIGMRINKPWKVHKWWPVARAMPRMIEELERERAHGFLGAENVFAGPLSPILIQYWTSFDALETYARNKQAEHLPAWGMFMNKSAWRATSGSGTRPMRSAVGNASMGICRNGAWPARHPMWKS